jgi:hypothetical protein
MFVLINLKDDIVYEIKKKQNKLIRHKNRIEKENLIIHFLVHILVIHGIRHELSQSNIFGKIIGR